MLRTLLGIMKRNGVVAGLFVFLAVGFVFPSLHAGHAHGVVRTAHQHDHASTAERPANHANHDVARADHGCEQGHGKHAPCLTHCNDDCCAPSCSALTALFEEDTYFGLHQSGRFLRPRDRHLSGLTPRTAERPPRA